MPAVSAKQKKFMDAAAHNPEFAKKAGISTDVAKEFSTASKGAQLGPRNRADLQGINKQKTDHGSMNLFKKGGVMKESKAEDRKEMAEDKKQDVKLIKKAFKEHDAQEHKGGKGTKLTLKKGGMAMKETMGPRTMAKDVEAGSNVKKPFGQAAVQKRGMTRGTNMGDSGPTMGIMGGGMKKGGGVKKMAKGGSASSRADGCVAKGKTKGRMI
jgi:hypothetical protein